MNLNPDQFFHGTKHDIKHLVRPSKDTDLDNYDYDGSALPKAHRSHTFAMDPHGGALPPKDAESAAWNWAKGPGRARVHVVETAEPKAPLKTDPNVIGAVMVPGALRIKDTAWIPPADHAWAHPQDANWDYNGPGHRQARVGADGREDRSEHVQGTLPPLNWQQHHVEQASHTMSGWEGMRAARAHVQNLEERFTPEREWNEPSVHVDQETLFPRATYRR